VGAGTIGDEVSVADSSPDLQFDHAEFDGGPTGPTSCAACAKTLADTYYQVGSVITCEACKGQIESQWARESAMGARLGRGVRATVFGLVAAIAGGAIYYAVMAVTDGWQVGLISVLVGFMVGSAVRRGAQGRGGWPYQGLAMFLTYSAIVLSFVPLMIRAADGATFGAPRRSAAAVLSLAIESAPRFYTLPFQMLFHSVSNAIVVLIIAFGVYEAWKLNRKQDLRFSGPYNLGTRPVSAGQP
jgi:hypothetical protein